MLGAGDCFLIETNRNDRRYGIKGRTLILVKMRQKNSPAIAGLFFMVEYIWRNHPHRHAHGGPCKASLVPCAPHPHPDLAGWVLVSKRLTPRLFAGRGVRRRRKSYCLARGVGGVNFGATKPGSCPVSACLEAMIANASVTSAFTILGSSDTLSCVKTCCRRSPRLESGLKTTTAAIKIARK